MSNIWKRAFALMIIIAAFGLLALSNVGAQSLSLKVTPVHATSNSVYTFIATWKDPGGTYPNAVKYQKADIPGLVVLTGIGYANSLLGGIPMYYYDHAPADGTGARYVVTVSSGLNMSSPYQNPDICLTSPDVTKPSSWYPTYSDHNNLLWDAYYRPVYNENSQYLYSSLAPMWEAPTLISWGNGPARTWKVTAFMWYCDKDGNWKDTRTEDSVDVTISDSRPNYQYNSAGQLVPEMIDYSGCQGDRDFLSAGGADDPDPLTVEPSNDGSGVTGDDGSASHDYVFRVKYRNRDGLPPMPWWHSNNYSPDNYMEVADYGVALYLDVFGIGDYRLIPMMPETGIEHNAAWTAQSYSDGVVFMARLQPNDGMAEPFLYEYNYKYFPAYTCWAYNALPVGTFNYFFACSDDWLRYTWNEPDLDTLNHTPDVPNFVLEMQPDPAEWGVTPNPGYIWNIPIGYTDYRHTTQLNTVCSAIDWAKVPSDATDSLWGYIPWGRNDHGLTYSCPPDFTSIPGHANNNALDPMNARAVTGNSDISRPAHRSYSTDNRYAFDSTIFVDRPVFVPGKFGSTYEYPSTQHPVVGGALTVPLWDDDIVGYSDLTKYGGGRYYGTLLMDGSFKRAMNPLMPGTYKDTSYSRDITARRAETAGATTSSQCTFRIMYKSKDGKGPMYVRVLIGNTSSRGSLSTDAYLLGSSSYPMSITMEKEDPSDFDYTDGVWYIATKNFTTPGPYHYLFEASDGSQKIVWPRRPDHYDYLGRTWDDWWVPTANKSDDYFIDDPNNAGQKILNPDYDNNDFVPGPYVNNAPVLTVGSDSVSPTSGKRGQMFKFRVKYSDPDGQRPYAARLIIQTDSKGTQRVCNMLPEVVFSSSADNSAKYKEGVYYYYNMSSSELEKGTRSYKFQFVDDWGRQVGTDDTLEGQTVTTSWMSNLTVTDNNAPTLYSGSVESADGTSNGATKWTFSATYADLDNDPPAVKKVFIGLLQPDGKTVLWDEGHDMLQSDTGDTTYNDGVLFYYQTRLNGIQNEYDQEKQYYYAFLFQDGYEWATYRSSSNAALRSNAASCIEGEKLTPKGSLRYAFEPVIAQKGTADSVYPLARVRPSDPDNILDLQGVYLTEDLTGQNYYEPSQAGPVYKTGDDTVILTRNFTEKPTSVWLKYVPEAPVVGPLLQGTSSSATLISDAQVYDNDSLKLVDEMKNGWQRKADGDERYSIMMGTAVNSDGKASTIHVKPEDPSVIASVEGVYTTLKDVNDPSASYYDPTASIPVPNSVDKAMVGTIDPSEVYDQVARTGITVIPDSPRLIKSVTAVYGTDSLGNMYLIANSGLTLEKNGKIKLPESMPQPLGSKVYIYYTRTLFNTGDSLIWLTDTLPTAGQTVFIKYSDTRFTHTTKGAAQKRELIVDNPGEINDVYNWTQGTTHFSPDGWQEQDAGGNKVHIKGNDGIDNDGDPTAGVLGVWTYAADSSSYFEPFRSTSVNNPSHLELTYFAPSGTNAMWARYYQLGDYQIDRWNRIIEFLPGSEPAGTVSATYLFGTKMPDTVKENTRPTLDDGSVSPISSESATQQFVYKVTYKDTDGAHGQAPSYVRVYIDNAAHEMSYEGTGTPPYRDGAVYTYTATASDLGPKGHKYRFEACDGSDVAIYDYYTENGLGNRPTDPSVPSYINLDGPYINTMPTLSDGSATPGKDTTISTNTTVTFAVKYQDADNDVPYFFDSTTDVNGSGAYIGQDVSGSPRLWVDGDGKDTLVLGKVSDLAADSLDSNKMRTIVATNIDGTPVSWKDNVFAGKLMQITSDTLKYRVYLISGNTANTLTVATDNLGDRDKGGDGLQKDSTFTINGLLMIRQDTNAYSSGTLYQLTVPKLGIGGHAYRFTARSRVDKPQWLIDEETAAGKAWVPYSAKAQFPTDGTPATGPTVTSAAPTGNVAPELTSAELLYGVNIKAATVESSSKIKLDYSSMGNWSLQEVQNNQKVLGVYWNANPTDSDTNYYDTTQTFNPTSSNEIALSPALGSVPSELVQLGTVGSSLTVVTPDSISSIDNIAGVYDNADLTGTNYFTGVPVDGATTLTLDKALPIGTRSVYIEYTPKAGVQPPVYITYYKSYDSTSAFLPGDNLTFMVKYSDADNDPPTYHDGVTGYIQLVFNDDASGLAMEPVTVPTSYKTPVQFKVTTDDLPEGSTKYHFIASDGYDPDHKVRYPANSSDDKSITVNCKPVLSGALIDPTSGQQATTFKFNVTYKDLDGSGAGALTPRVSVKLTNVSTAATYTISLSPKETSPVYANGAVFTGSTASLPVGTYLSPGTYNVTFEANDGYQYADPVTYNGGLVVRDYNNAPSIVSFSVSPTAGKTSQTFVYKANYRDADNDPPVFGSGTSKSEGLTLVVDKGLTTSQTFAMARTPSTTTTAPDYTATGGVEYQASVVGTKLGIGSHTYTVQASDGTDSASTPASKVGPVLLVPSFENLRFVNASAADPDAAGGITSAAVGQNVLIVGHMLFPINTLTGKPDTINNVTIQVTKPTGAAVSLVGSVTITDKDSTYWIGELSVPTYPSGIDSSLVTGENLTLSASGVWNLNASWDGGSSWNKVETDDVIDGVNDYFSVSVGGPMRTIAIKDPSNPDDSAADTPVVDMITPPMIIGSSDPGKIFGYDNASLMQLVRWYPALGSYYRFGGSTTFPGLAPGEAIWIKPKSSYAKESISSQDAESGLLMADNSDGLDFSRKYRLIKVFAQAYNTQVNSTTGETELVPCNISLKAGWNQFGNIFFNWKKDSSGNDITPKVDVGIPFSELHVKYLNAEKTLDQAAAAGWIRNYAWRWDPSAYDYVLVQAGTSGAEHVLKAWYGYWIKAFVNCTLIVDPNTSYNGESSTSSVSSLRSATPSTELMNDDMLDMPPKPKLE
ncbi:MAG: hypothetical protein ABFD83_14975 [Armatimonadota bacterium]